MDHLENSHSLRHNVLLLSFLLRIGLSTSPCHDIIIHKKKYRMNADLQHLEIYPTCTNAVLINLQMQALKHTFNFTHITNSASSKNINYTFVSPSPWIFAGRAWLNKTVSPWISAGTAWTKVNPWISAGRAWTKVSPWISSGRAWTSLNKSHSLNLCK